MNQIRVRHISRFLEHWAPQSTQLEYDNAGLLTGSPETPVNGILTCLDVTQDVVDEAVQKNCNLIVAHHPVIFRGIKTLRTDHKQGKLLQNILARDVQVIAVHTNIDAALNGVSFVLAGVLGLENTRFLKNESRTLVHVWFRSAQPSKAVELLNGLGGSQITVNGEHVSGIIESYQIRGLEKLLGDPVMSVSLDTLSPHHGFGVVGTFREPVSHAMFLNLVCEKLQTPALRYAGYSESIQTVAVCGGSGSNLISDAKLSGADAFVTADIKYHDFFEAQDGFTILDAGHYETEVPIVSHLADEIKKTFQEMPVFKTGMNTNPMRSFIKDVKQRQHT